MGSLVYALLAYLAFLVSAGGLFVWTLAIETPGASAGPWPLALGVNLGLLLLFGLQHSVMARDGFKRALLARLPGTAERSHYVLASSLALGGMMLGWQDLPGQLWQVDGVVAHGLRVLGLLGWGLAVLATFSFDHARLFGLRQAWARYRGEGLTEPAFSLPWLYRQVRHPMMTGFLAGFWLTPQMSTDRLLFALGMTVYVLIALRYEEADLRRHLGADYERYARQTPALLPTPWRRRA
ncbi:MAG TPA: NnrU family protein [Nevskiaceae bacterium]|nr:NnrU family protein [Nevskiaceae bacterium]